MLSVDTIEFIKWAGGGLFAATGGSKAVLSGVRWYLKERKERKAVRADNEEFKTEMRRDMSAIKKRVESELGPNGGGSMRDTVTVIAARQSAILNLIPTPTFSTDTYGRFIDVNRGFEELTGYGAHDLYGMGWVNVIYQDDQEDFIEFWLHAVKDQRPARRRVRLETKDGRVLLVAIEAQPMRPTSSSSFIGLFGTVADEGMAA